MRVRCDEYAVAAGARLLGDGPRPALGALSDRRLALALPPGPRRGPVPGPRRNDPLPTDAGREHRRRERAALRAVPGRPVARAVGSAVGRAADPRDRLLPRQGADDPGVRPGPPRALRRRGSPVVRRADLAPRGRPEDRELRPRLRLRDTGDPGRYPRPPHRQPLRDPPDADPGGDGGPSPGDRRPPVLDPPQPAPRPARAEPVPADRTEVRGVPSR